MDFDSVRDSIFPWIKAKLPAEAEDADNTPAADLVVMDFLADLCVTFAVDEGEHFSLLQRSDLPEGMTTETLYTLAKKNLTEQVEFTLTGTSYGGYGILAGGDHEAGALCLDFIWDMCAREIARDLVIAVPAKDCLFMALADDPEQVAAMKAISRDIFEHGERTLTRTLLYFSAASRKFSVFGTLQE